MADFSASARVPAAGTTCQVRIQHNRSGIDWVVSQISVETIPATPAGLAVVRRNGRYLTDTTQLPAGAQGQPFYKLSASDVLTIDFSNLVAGTTAICTVSYQEGTWGSPLDGVVV